MWIIIVVTRGDWVGNKSRSNLQLMTNMCLLINTCLLKHAHHLKTSTLLLLIIISNRTILYNNNIINNHKWSHQLWWCSEHNSYNSPLLDKIHNHQNSTHSNNLSTLTKIMITGTTCSPHSGPHHHLHILLSITIISVAHQIAMITKSHH